MLLVLTVPAIAWLVADTGTTAPNLSDPATYLVQLPLAAALLAIFVFFVVRPKDRLIADIQADRKAEAAAAAAALAVAQTQAATEMAAAQAEIRRLNDERARRDQEQSMRDREMLMQIAPRLQQSLSALQVTGQGLEGALKQQPSPSDELVEQIRVLTAEVRDLRAARDGKT